MAPLASYFARASVQSIAHALPDAVRNAVDQILKLVDASRDDTANVAEIHEQLFPLAANAASANASLNRVIREFNQAAERAKHPVRIEITASKKVGAHGRSVWFEGPAPAPAGQRSPEIDAIPDDQLISGQEGAVLHEEATIVLLTVNEHETRELIARFHPGGTPDTDTRDRVAYNILGRVGDVHVVHALCEMGSGGVGATYERTRDAIDAWRPRAVIAVGIAFGVDDRKQKIGDVLVSKHIQAYELARVNRDTSLTPRGDKPHASRTLLNRIQHLHQSLSKEDKQRLRWPVLHVGTLLSGEKLIDNLGYRDSLRARFDTEAIGGEMEGSGLYAAASRHNVDWIVVKGICDFADGHKGKDKERHQRLAATNAATVVWHALGTTGLFPPRDERSAAPAQKSGRTAPGRAPARPCPPIDGMGLGDLEGVGNLLQDQVHARKTSLRKEMLDPRAREADDDARVDALDYLYGWATDDQAPPLFALLGEYGMGKTISCQRLAKRLDAARKLDSWVPVPIYFDLRHVTGLHGQVPSVRETITQCVDRGWRGDQRQFDLDLLNELMDQGALVILDGLDEALVKLNEADGQAFTNALIKLLVDALARRRERGGAGPLPRMLVSCRTQYFRTLRDQQTHFTGQERGGPGPEAYRALLLLPFDEEHIRSYLAAALPDADIERVLATLRSVHNLEELAQRPYTLKLVAEFIPEIEHRRARGEVVRGVTLYRLTVERWLQRDSGKHHIKPEHKLRLVAHLAAEMSRSGRSLMPADQLEDWFHGWLDAHPTINGRYRDLHPDHLEEDLRTATFLRRVDGAEESGFRFAHTSLHEFFLASYLFDAIVEDAPDRWALPEPSDETLGFLGQLLEEAGARGHAALSTLGSWRHSYRAQASELLLAYTLKAHRARWPAPTLHGIDLSGANLRDRWLVGSDDRPLNLGPAKLVAADLRAARLEYVAVAGADLRGARLERSEWRGCTLAGASLQDVLATGAVFRYCDLSGSIWNGARARRARFVHSPGPPIDQIVVAPRPYLPATTLPRLGLSGGRPGGASAIAFTPNGRELVSGGSDGTLLVWDTETHELLRTLDGNGGGTCACAVSPDGDRILSGDRDGKLELRDRRTGVSTVVIEAHAGVVTDCQFAPSGRWFLSTSTDGTLRIADATTGEALQQLSHPGISACAIAPDSASILAGDQDGRLWLWNAVSGAIERELAGPGAPVCACAFAADGQRLVAVGRDGSITWWSAVTGARIRVLSVGQLFKVSALSPNGRWLAGLDFSLQPRIWDAESGELRATLDRRGNTTLAWAPDGQRLAMCGEWHGPIRFWSTAGEEVVYSSLIGPAPQTACLFLSDGLQVLSGGFLGWMAWDLVTGLAKLRAEASRFGSMPSSFSDDGTLVAEVGRGVAIRDTASGETLKRFDVGSLWARASMFTSDSESLVVLNGDGQVMVFDIPGGSMRRIDTKQDEGFVLGEIGPDGTRVLRYGDDIKLWDLEEGVLLHNVDLSTESRASVAAFSRDGTRFAIGHSDGQLILWDAATCTTLRSFDSVGVRVTACAFSRDDTRLLSGDEIGILRLWDVASGRLLRTFEAHLGWVSSCTFSPDGQWLSSTAADGTMRLWDASTGKTLRIHAVAEWGEHAVWEPATNRIIEATDGVWRWLHWQVLEVGEDGREAWMPIPLESFGDPPRPEHMIVIDRDDADR